MERVILHSDCNCFYAGCEMMRNPRLRDIPFAVAGPEEERRGIILTANYPAKRKGVKTGMVRWEAKRTCPDLKFVPARYRDYQHYSQYINGIYRKYTNLVQPFGLDESWLDVSGSVGLFGDGITIAKKISQEVKETTGLTVSIGVSHNKVLAKLGSDMKKPDAITVLSKDNWREKVWPLPVGDLLYVGRKTEAKLQSRYVRTIGDLAQTDEKWLVEWFGVIGSMLHGFANGADYSPVSLEGTEEPIQSIGNSSTTPRDLVNDTDVHLWVRAMAESVAARMIESGFAATKFSVSIRRNDMSGFTRQCSVAVPTILTRDIVDNCMRLFKRNNNWSRDLPIRHVGVRAFGLVPADAPRQISLDYSASKMLELEELEKTIIRLRQRFGNNIIQRGTMYSDPVLAGLDVKSEHTIHPTGLLTGGGVIQWREWSMKYSA